MHERDEMRLLQAAGGVTVPAHHVAGTGSALWVICIVSAVIFGGFLWLVRTRRGREFEEDARARSQASLYGKTGRRYRNTHDDDI
jgi:hypothetical protein